MSKHEYGSNETNAFFMLKDSEFSIKRVFDYRDLMRLNCAMTKYHDKVTQIGARKFVLIEFAQNNLPR